MAIEYDAPAPNDGGDPNAAQASDNPEDYSTVQWLMAWAVLGIVLFLANKSKLGHAIIYYGLALLLLFLLVTNYRWFANVLAPFSALRPGLVPPVGTPQSAGGPGGAATNGGGAGGGF